MSVVPFKLLRLPNGLQLIGEVRPSAKSSALGFFVNTGSRDELPEESGVSHFLEHMAFKGSARRSSMDITMALGNLAAKANACTSEESTIYYAAVLPEYFESMLDLLTDLLTPVLDPAEYDMERKVILEEIARYQDRPTSALFEQATKEYFGSHPAGNSVLGSTESITKLPRDQMAAYFARRYAPSNMVLVAAGNFDWDRFVATAERLCGGWRDFSAPRHRSRHVASAMSHVYRRKNLKQTHIFMLTNGPAAQDEERYAFELLMTMLGDSSSSKIYWALIDSGLADSATIEHDVKDGVGCSYAYASTEPQRADEVADILRAVLAKPLDFSTHDLARAKTKVISRMVLGGELPLGRMMALGQEWLTAESLTTLEEEMAKYRAVTKHSIQAALEKFPVAPLAEFRMVGE